MDSKENVVLQGTAGLRLPPCSPVMRALAELLRLRSFHLRSVHQTPRAALCFASLQDPRRSSGAGLLSSGWTSLPRDVALLGVAGMFVVRVGVALRPACWPLPLLTTPDKLRTRMLHWSAAGMAQSPYPASLCPSFLQVLAAYVRHSVYVAGEMYSAPSIVLQVGVVGVLQ